MAIVRLNKVTLLGPIAEKEITLDRLQAMGCMHIVNLSDAPETRESSSDVSVDAHDALKYLQTCPTQRRQITELDEFDFEAVVAEVTATHQKHQKIEDEYDAVLNAIETAEPWGDFRVPPPEELRGLRCFFYLLPRGQASKIEFPGVIWELVGQTERNDYVIVLAENEPPGFPGTRVDLDPRSVTQLRRRLVQIEEELDAVQHERAALTRWSSLISRKLDEADDLARLRHVARQTHDEDPVFVVQGWIPKVAAKAIEDFALKHHLAIEMTPATVTDAPPTLLKNPKAIESGEDTVTFYMTPGYHSWDPSPVVLFSFALFFGMILSDAGYAVCLAVILALLWPKLSKSEAGIRFRNLMSIIVLASIAWGVMIGSYFGFEAPFGTFLGSLRVPWLDTSNTNRMMMLSILIGVGHLVLANAITCWRYLGTWRALLPFGWILNLTGGLTAGLSGFEVIGPAFFSVGIGMMIAGSLTVLFFASTRPLPPKGIGDFALRLVDGLMALTSASAAFGDVLSYLRLFALGLAGTQLAVTFNNLSNDVGGSIPGLGILLGMFVFLLGHSLNFVLSIMGGVVHGLRLNCIEFFNWSALDEGYPFKAFNKKAGT